MNDPEPLHGSAPQGRPARLLGTDEVDALTEHRTEDPDEVEDEDDEKRERGDDPDLH